MSGGGSGGKFIWLTGGVRIKWSDFGRFSVINGRFPMFWISLWEVVRKVICLTRDGWRRGGAESHRSIKNGICYRNFQEKSIFFSNRFFETAYFPHYSQYYYVWVKFRSWHPLRKIYDFAHLCPQWCFQKQNFGSRTRDPKFPFFGRQRSIVLFVNKVGRMRV